MRVAKRRARKLRNPIPGGASAEVMAELYTSLVLALVDIMSSEVMPSAMELNVVRQFLKDQGIRASSVQGMRGHLSKLAEAALAAPFDLKDDKQ